MCGFSHTRCLQSRFDSREFVLRGWSERGRPIEIPEDFEHVRSYSVSCLTDLTLSSGFYITPPIAGSQSVFATRGSPCFGCRHEQRNRSPRDHGQISRLGRSSARRHSDSRQLQNSQSARDSASTGPAAGRNWCSHVFSPTLFA